MTDAVTTLAAHCREIDLATVPVYKRGVYLLISEDVVYVGQSIDVDFRIAWHANEATKAFDRAIWLELPEPDLDAFEGALIRVFDPPHSFGAPACDDERDAKILASLGLKPNPDARRSFEARRKTRRSGVREPSFGQRRTQALKTKERMGKRKRLRRLLWRAVKPLLEQIA